MNIDPLAQALKDEFKRVAKEEDVPMADLVAEVAALVNVSERQLYNYRSGRWPIPSRIIPIICRRFKSNSLLSTLRGQVNEGQANEGTEEGTGFECGNVSQKSMELLRVIIDHHASLLNRLEASTFDAADLLHLEETSARIIQGEREMFTCAEIEYERRRVERRRRA